MPRALAPRRDGCLTRTAILLCSLACLPCTLICLAATLPRPASFTVAPIYTSKCITTYGSASSIGAVLLCRRLISLGPICQQDRSQPTVRTPHPSRHPSSRSLIRPARPSAIQPKEAATCSARRAIPCQPAASQSHPGFTVHTIHAIYAVICDICSEILSAAI